MTATGGVQLTLFGTLGCHLCEQAEWLLLPLVQEQGWQLRTVDIAELADSEAAISRYGLRIPVLACAGAELDWPFDLAQASAFVRSQQNRQNSDSAGDSCG